MFLSFSALGKNELLRTGTAWDKITSSWNSTLHNFRRYNILPRGHLVVIRFLEALIVAANKTIY